ncbi:tumor necrosis factor receptor superfamily member 13B [Antennarius striatus]|uniref:tumor necrosis factor receptor superfamily member 13B n=1 Tax=Antennarius striatus TaxID=241820 RepID=UPI0035B1E3D0
MAAGCPSGLYWDALIKKCMSCHMECQRPHVIPRCTSFCVSAKCKALPGHYYDGLLKKCMRCSEVCGRHPAECSQHCQTPTSPVPAETHPVDATSHVPSTQVSTSLESSTILLYHLLALCLVLLFSSLCLALVVFQRGAKAKTPNSRPKKANHNQKCVVQHGQEVTQLCCQLGRISNDYGTKSNHPVDCEPIEDSSPTETCVCIHCFPEMKVSGQENDRLPKAPFSLYPQVVLHKANNPGPVWTEGNVLASGQQAQQEAAVGRGLFAVLGDKEGEDSQCIGPVSLQTQKILKSSLSEVLLQPIPTSQHPGHIC